MTVTVASIQMDSRCFDLAGNREKAERLILRAAAQGARLILLPELFNVGYTYDDRLREHAEPFNGETALWLQELSRRTGSHIGAGICESSGLRLYNTVLLVEPGGKLHVYRKRNPAFFENLFFDSGQRLGVFSTPLGRIGVLICWDMVHSRLTREMIGKIDLLIICSAWPNLLTGNIPLPLAARWMSRQPVHRPQQLAQQLQVPVVFSNMTGRFSTRVPGFGVRYCSKFAGSTAIIDPVQRCRIWLDDEEAVLIGKVSIARPHRNEVSWDRWDFNHSTGRFKPPGLHTRQWDSVEVQC